MAPLFFDIYIMKKSTPINLNLCHLTFSKMFWLFLLIYSEADLRVLRVLAEKKWYLGFDSDKR